MTVELHTSYIFRYSLKLGNSLLSPSLPPTSCWSPGPVTSIIELPSLAIPTVEASPPPRQSPCTPLWYAGLVPLSPTLSSVTFLRTTSDHIPSLLKTPITLSLSGTILHNLASPFLSSLCFCLSPYPPTSPMENLLFPVLASFPSKTTSNQTSRTPQIKHPCSLFQAE